MTQTRQKEKSKPSFPITKLIIGSVFATLFWNGYLYEIFSYIRNTNERLGYATLGGIFIGATTVGFCSIPMFVAYKRNTQNANAVYWVAFVAMWVPPASFPMFLTALIMACTGRQTTKKITERKVTKTKIELVNDDNYLNLKKSDRIKYLQNLKKQSISELEKYRNKLEKERNRLNDMPDDVMEYIKPKYANSQDISSIENNITYLKNKITAINELIKSETKTSKVG